MSNKIKFDVFLEEYDSASQLPSSSLNLLNRARESCDRAYAPYSNFLVGAAVLLENGEVFAGSNQENVAFPSGLCAERVALFAAATTFPNTAILKVSVSAKKRNASDYLEVSPCGGCRQAISEYQTLQDTPIEIIMEGPSGKVRMASVDMLLPFKFSAQHLRGKE